MFYGGTIGSDKNTFEFDDDPDDAEEFISRKNNSISDNIVNKFRNQNRNRKGKMQSSAAGEYDANVYFLTLQSTFWTWYY